jgi:hypothetical protein
MPTRFTPYAAGCLVDKATTHYARRCEREGCRFDQPSSYSSGVEEVDGKLYVALRNGCGLIAAYRVDGSTHHMRFVAPDNWPPAIAES